MIRFVKLTHRNGEPIWVNPTQVMSVAPVFNERDGGNEIGCAVTTDRGTIIVEKMNLGLLAL